MNCSIILLVDNWSKFLIRVISRTRWRYRFWEAGRDWKSTRIRIPDIFQRILMTPQISRNIISFLLLNWCEILNCFQRLPAMTAIFTRHRYLILTFVSATTASAKIPTLDGEKTLKEHELTKALFMENKKKIFKMVNNFISLCVKEIINKYSIVWKVFKWQNHEIKT